MTRHLNVDELAERDEKIASYVFGVDELVARIRQLLAQDGPESTALRTKVILQTSFPADQLAGLAAVALLRIAEQQPNEPQSQPVSTSEDQ